MVAKWYVGEIMLKHPFAAAGAAYGCGLTKTLPVKTTKL
jgi:hypothetical protein